MVAETWGAGMSGWYVKGTSRWGAFNPWGFPQRNKDLRAELSKPKPLGTLRQLGRPVTLMASDLGLEK